MGKKSKAQKLNFATDSAKDLGPTSETPINGSDHLEPEPVEPMKPSNNKSKSVRRSGRLQSIIRPVKNQAGEPIDLVESDREEDEPHCEDKVEQPLVVAEPHNNGSRNGSTTVPKMVDEKVDDLINAFEVLKSKLGAQVNVLCDSASVGDMYKSLYLDSQKKIEALTSENHELARKLEVALGKLEVYEKINISTETTIISNLEKATEALVQSTSLGGNLSSEGGGGGGDDGDGGGVSKESSAKKRKQDQTK